MTNVEQQMYSVLDEDINVLVQPFCEESERLWKGDIGDALTNVAALQLLSLAYVGHGKDHCVLRFRNEACLMAQRMSLLGAEPSVASKACDDIPEDMKIPSSYVAWGLFNWIVLVRPFPSACTA